VPKKSQKQKQTAYDYDYLIIGSGFGGSVSAMRLTEKGYKVGVIEAGKRFDTHEFPKTNWNLRKFLWMPSLGMHGIMRMTLLRDGLILSGAGVGGGSLCYANTLLVPPAEVFKGRTFGVPEKDNVHETLLPYYNLAKRMLGVTRSPLETPMDRTLREVATDMGKGDTYHRPTVGVYFGQPGKTVADPYFGGQGPDRMGCNYCGGCMVGCRVGAKNTLDKNYLYFAEKNGAEILPETKATLLREISGGGYAVDVERSTSRMFKHKRTLRARAVVLAAGALGTNELLLRSREAGEMERLSDKVGDYVRTNSEAILGVKLRDADADVTKGISITSGVHPDKDTHIEVVRYPKGSDAMAPLATLLTDGGGGVPRQFKFLLNILRSPLDFVGTLNPFGWARRTVILLVMQTLDNYMRMGLRRRWWWPFSKSLDSYHSPGNTKPPSYIPVANEFVRQMAKKLNGVPSSSINEVLFDVPTTAHIMGGAVIADSPATGVVDRYNRVFGYKDLYVCDGSMLPANLGVNPSLSITALTEHAMHQIPAKEGAVVREPIGYEALTVSPREEIERTIDLDELARDSDGVVIGHRE
jgi:cholesterol oxidase